MGHRRRHLVTTGAAAGLATVLAAFSAGAGSLAGAGAAAAATGHHRHKAASGKHASSGSSKDTVRLSKEPGVGHVLVNSAGQTLYAFAKDKHGKATCTGACTGVWPPLTVTGKPVAGKGIDKKRLGTVKDAAGQRQVTYDHRPLYTYVADTKPGQDRGEGITSFGGKWWTVDKKGKEVHAHSSSSGSYGGSSYGGSSGSSHSTSTSTTSGGGYGY